MIIKNLFTSESVGVGHPDKLCDQISDAVLDAYLTQDTNARVAVETMASGKLIVVSGEITSTANVDIEKIVKNVFQRANQWNDEIQILINIQKQSPDIAQGVDLSNGEIGAGDQGIMFGFATNETAEYMPLALTLSHAILKEIENYRINEADLNQENQKFHQQIKSDMKSQVTVDYSGSKPIIDTVLVSVQHLDFINDNEEQEFKNFISNKIIKVVLNKYGFEQAKRILINPTGKFVIGGIVGDTGLTGRKIIMDTYGGAAKHGGGAFSGKDSTKVDRSAAYACRWIAKNLVAAGILPKVEIQVSYAIGIAEPTSIYVDTFGYGDNKYLQNIIQVINDVFDLRPSKIIQALELRKPIFEQTATFGHFGRNDLDLPWERLNKVEEIKTKFNQLMVK
ncbi:methionine adenosyltransferase [Mycoplasmopsis gallinarum]|uniref:Methionine adenosyltransferase n=1 Tax=Mycoplasmopsis gallinarum TaxID=29557 RepID=A0A168RM18_9BACT|nr:methionine adenosyltransferase [Mycoplasmopsis gallinarum]OAB49109.1 S-adenosylmethionine synthetase [Mycoplasmopsis gallinarum]